MANCQLPPPDPMVCAGNVAVNWKAFKEAYTDFATATQLNDKDDTIKIATLKTVMGRECQQILSRIELTEEDKKKPTKILKKLEEYFAPIYSEYFVQMTLASLSSAAAKRDCGPVHNLSTTLSRILQIRKHKR